MIRRDVDSLTPGRDFVHAFNADCRPSCRQAAAEDGWKRCRAWFNADGVA